MARKEEQKVIIDSKMRIILDDKWELTADSMNYILHRKYKNRSVIEGYYQTLEDLLDSLFDKKLKETEVKSLRSMLREVKAIREDIKAYSEILRKHNDKK